MQGKIKAHYYIVYIICLLFLIGCKTSTTISRNSSTTPKPADVDFEISKTDSITIDDFLQVLDGKDLIPRKYEKLFIDTLHITAIQGKKLYKGLLYEELERVFRSQNRFTLVADKDESDVYLRTKLTKYHKFPLILNELQVPISYQISIYVDLLVYLTKGVEKEEHNLLLARENVRYEITYIEKGSEAENLQLAERRLWNGIAQRILLILDTGWYTEDKTIKELNYNPNQDNNVIIRRDLPFEKREELEEQIKEQESIKKQYQPTR